MAFFPWKSLPAAALLFGQAVAAPPELDWRQLPPLPDPCGFASPFAGQAGDACIVAGGANFPDRQLWDGGSKVWHDRIFALRPDGAGWRIVGRLPGPRAYGVSASIPDGLACIGGSDEKRHYADAFVLRWEKDAVERLEFPPLPIPIAMAAGTRVGDVIYVAGGLSTPDSKEPLTSFFALDLRDLADGWKKLPSWPGSGRFQAVAASVGGWFYLFSGLRYEPSADGKPALVYLKDAFRYSPSAGWEKLPDLPYPVAAGASPAPTGKSGIYLLGGVDGAGAGKSPREFFHVPQRIQFYDPAAAVWHDAGFAPVGRVCVSASFWGDRWVLPSGERSAGVRSPEVWSLRLPD
jgi:N-acetylneuraminate epimerase